MTMANGEKKMETVEKKPYLARVVNVASSASSVQLLSAKSTRAHFSIFNDSTAVLYVKFGGPASSTSYTVKVIAGAYFESPYPCYQGEVHGIWATANGYARITEVS